MSSPFYLQKKRFRNDGFDEDLGSESDFEHLCPKDDGDESHAAHYWYGKLNFTHQLATSIIQEARPGMTCDKLDVSVPGA